MGLFSKIGRFLKKAVVTPLRQAAAVALPIAAPLLGGLAVNLLGIAPRTRGPASVAFQQRTFAPPPPTSASIFPVRFSARLV